MDDMGDSIKAKNAGWTFGGETAKNFDVHVEKSVPFYHQGHDLISKISDYFLNKESVCYELGCSTGTLIAKLAQRHRDKNVRIIGVDSEEEMISCAQEKCGDAVNVTLVNSDIIDMKFEKSDLIIAYYTIQFIKPKDRQIIFDRIYESLNWGGGFLLFEKVRAPDARFQDMMTGIYTDYKLDQGYNEEEIIGKLRSLKGVLEPFSVKGNHDLLTRAGFIDYMTIMKYVCFQGFLAIK